jgi:hypothetical protein
LTIVVDIAGVPLFLAASAARPGERSGHRFEAFGAGASSVSLICSK